MATTRVRGGSYFRPVAIALIVEDGDGGLMIMGSKSLYAAELEMRQDAIPDFGGGYTRYAAGPRSYRIEAECHDLIMQRTTPAPTPPQIEQRGIYLPDMSFRALPSPEES
jgi:hypothetical protein